MKRLLILFLLLGAAYGQTATSGTVTGSGCFGIDASNSGTLWISVRNSGTAWSGTIQPSASIGGDPVGNVQVYPSNSTTAQNTITANGLYRLAASGVTYIQLCGNTVTNTAAIKFQPANFSLNLGTGSSGGAGTVTSVALADSTGTFNVTGSPVTTTGTLTLGTFANQAGGSVLSNNSGSSGAPAFNTSLTLAGKFTGAASTTGAATLNIPAGSAPTVPVSGDLWDLAGILQFYDGTNKNSLTSIQAAVTTGDCARFSGTAGLLVDSGSANCGGGVTTSSPLSGTTALSCPTCGVTGTGLGQFAATTSSQFFGVISDETGSGLVPGATSATLVTPHVTQILDGNGNVFLTSSATSTAVDSVTITNAATANPALVSVAATGTDTNIGLSLGVKGTGTLQFPGGALGNPTVCNTISLTVCFWGKSSSFPFAYSNSTANMAAFGSTAATVFTLSSTSVLGYTNSTDATATKDIGLSRVSTSILGVGTGAAGTIGGWLSSASPCALTAGATISVSGTAVTICTWSIPTGASNWQWECKGSWAITAGTTPSIAFGLNYSQTPTKETGSGKIYTTAALVGTSASNVSTTSTGALSIVTASTLTTSATFFPFETNGTLQSSATAGTFILTVTGTGTSVAGTLGTDTECNLWPN